MPEDNIPYTDKKLKVNQIIKLCKKLAKDKSRCFGESSRFLAVTKYSGILIPKLLKTPLNVQRIHFCKKRSCCYPPFNLQC